MGDNNNNNNNNNYAEYDDDDGFENYESITIDPSPWALVVSIGISVVLILLIPFCMAVRERVRKRAGKQYEKEEEQDESGKGRSPSRKKKKQQQPLDDDTENDESVVTTDYQAMDNDNNPTASPTLPPAVLRTTGSEEDVIDFDFEELDPGDDPYGLQGDDGEEEVFENEYGWMKGDRRRNKQAVQNAAGVAVQVFGLMHLVNQAKKEAQEEQEKDFSLVHYGLDAGEEAFSWTDTGYAVEDSVELQRHINVETRIDMQSDYVEMTDHANLKIEGSPSRNTVPLGAQDEAAASAAAMDQYGSAPPGTPVKPAHTKKIDVNLWTGKRPWYVYFCSRGFYHKVAKCASYDKEMKGLFKLAVPFTMYSVLSNVIGLMEVAVIGRLVGTAELTAYYLVGFVISISTMWIDGIWSAVYTACGHAVGAEQYRLAGQYVQMVTILYQLWLIPFCVLWWFYFDPFVLWLGFDEEVKEIAGTYAVIAFLHTLVSPYDSALHYLLEVTDRATYSSVIGILGSAASFGAVLFSAMTWDLTLLDIGYIHLALEGIFLALDLVVILNAGWFRGGYWQGMLGSFSFCNWRAVKNIFKLSLPLTLGYLMAYGEWQALFFFAGMMGPAEIAVWGLMGSVWSAIEGISLSTTYAAEVRVAKHLGSNKPRRARYAAHKSLFVGVITSIIVSVPVLFLGDHISSMFTTDTTLQTMFNELVPYVCAGNITMAFGSMCWTLLGAQGRYGLATFSGTVGSWFVTLPLSALSTVVLGYDLQGIMAAMIIGYSCSGALNSYFLLRSNWTKLSKKIQKKNGGLEEGDGIVAEHPDDGFDHRTWDELPLHAKAAATAVGITQTHWDSGERPTLGSRAWDSLNQTEKSAIELLGYGKKEEPAQLDMIDPLPQVAEETNVQAGPDPNNTSLDTAYSMNSVDSFQKIAELQREISDLEAERERNFNLPTSPLDDAVVPQTDTERSEQSLHPIVTQERTAVSEPEKSEAAQLPPVVPTPAAAPAVAAPEPEKSEAAQLPPVAPTSAPAAAPVAAPEPEKSEAGELQPVEPAPAPAAAPVSAPEPEKSEAGELPPVTLTPAPANTPVAAPEPEKTEVEKSQPDATAPVTALEPEKTEVEHLPDAAGPTESTAAPEPQKEARSLPPAVATESIAVPEPEETDVGPSPLPAVTTTEVPVPAPTEVAAPEEPKKEENEQSSTVETPQTQQQQQSLGHAAQQHQQAQVNLHAIASSPGRKKEETLLSVVVPAPEPTKEEDFLTPLNVAPASVAPASEPKDDNFQTPLSTIPPAVPAATETAKEQATVDLLSFDAGDNFQTPLSVAGDTAALAPTAAQKPVDLLSFDAGETVHSPLPSATPQAATADLLSFDDEPKVQSPDSTTSQGAGETPKPSNEQSDASPPDFLS